MSVYARVPAYVDEKRHPRTLILILAGHAVLIAAVMTAKMELPPKFIPTITQVRLLPEETPRPENPPPPQPSRHDRTVDHQTTIVPIPLPQQPQVETPQFPQVDRGPVVQPNPIQVLPPAQPVRTGPRFVTPASDVKPPYPDSKLRTGEEAVLELKLTIDERGRVTAVDPVGKADPVFLAAARRHILARWRYSPATEDGHAVATSTVVTLRFQLQD
jgi:protein TonB